MKYVGLQEQIRSNRLKCVFLIAAYPVILFLTVIYIYGFFETSDYKDIFTEWYSPYITTVDGRNILQRMTDSMSFGHGYTIACIMIGLPIIGLSGMSEEMIEDTALRSSIYETSVWHQRKAEKALKNVSLKVGIKPPALRIIQSDSMNAYASGLTKNSYTVSLTQGIINGLTGPQLECVIAHEITHIINRDTLMLTIGIVFTGFYTIIISLCACLALFGALGKSSVGLVGIGTHLFIHISSYPQSAADCDGKSLYLARTRISCRCGSG